MQHPGKCDQAHARLVTQAPGVPCFSGGGLQHGSVGWGGSRGVVGGRLSPPSAYCAEQSQTAATDDALLQQSATDLLVGSEEDETAQTDEGHPRDAACKQTGEKQGREQRVTSLILQNHFWSAQLIFCRIYFQYDFIYKQRMWLFMLISIGCNSIILYAKVDVMLSVYCCLISIWDA